jgi:hypothetical protein
MLQNNVTPELQRKGVRLQVARTGGAAVRTSARVAPLDQRAASIMQAVRLEYPNGWLEPGPMPSPPAELYELQRQRNKIVQESVRGLEVELGPAGFTKLAGYLKQYVPQDASPPAASGPAGARPFRRTPRTFEVEPPAEIGPPEPGIGYRVSGSLRVDPYFCLEEVHSEPAQRCRYRFEPFRYGLLLMSPRPDRGFAGVGLPPPSPYRFRTLRRVPVSF